MFLAHTVTHPSSTVIDAAVDGETESSSPTALRTETEDAEGESLTWEQQIDLCWTDEAHTVTHLPEVVITPPEKATRAPKKVPGPRKKAMDRAEEALIAAQKIEDETLEEALAEADTIIGMIPFLEVPEIADARTVDDAKFRINNQRLLVTYAKSDLKKKALKEFFEGKSKKKNIPCKVKIARESHKDGTKHMHVLVDFGYRFQSTSFRIFDFEGRHPNIKPIAGLVHWVNALCYLGKEDKSNMPHPNIVAAAKAWNAKTPAEAFLSGACRRPADSMALFGLKPHVTSDIEVPEPNAHWFHSTLKPIMDGANHRNWHWFADFDGNTQKSWTCKFYFARYCSSECMDVLYLDLDCPMNDLCNLLSNEQANGWTGKVLMTDLPHSYCAESQFYTNLEKISNGFGTSSKYNGSKFLLRRNPIVIVFANWWPMLYDRYGEKTASTDRWKFYYIEQSLTAVCMNLSEVTAAREESDNSRRIAGAAKAIARKRVAEERADEVRIVPEIPQRARPRK